MLALGIMRHLVGAPPWARARVTEQPSAPCPSSSSPPEAEGCGRREDGQGQVWGPTTPRQGMAGGVQGREFWREVVEGGQGGREGEHVAGDIWRWALGDTGGVIWGR